MTGVDELYGIWWPPADAMGDLAVDTDSPDGEWTLSAPDGTECAAWLAHYNSTDELRARFNEAFVALLTDHLNTLEKHGGKVEVPDGGEADREQTQENLPGQLAQHQA